MKIKTWPPLDPENFFHRWMPGLVPMGQVPGNVRIGEQGEVIYELWMLAACWRHWHRIPWKSVEAFRKRRANGAKWKKKGISSWCFFRHGDAGKSSMIWLQAASTQVLYGCHLPHPSRVASFCGKYGIRAVDAGSIRGINRLTVRAPKKIGCPVSRRERITPHQCSWFYN